MGERISKHHMNASHCQSPDWNRLCWLQKYEDLLVLSLGTGQKTVAYDAKTTSKWGALSWIYNNGNIPLFDILMTASQDIADYSMSNAFFEQSSQDNYLRIQVSKVSVRLRYVQKQDLGMSGVYCLVVTLGLITFKCYIW